MSWSCSVLIWFRFHLTLFMLRSYQKETNETPNTTYTWTLTPLSLYIYIYISIYVFVWRKHLKIQLESPNFVAFLLLNFWARVLWIVVVFSRKIKTQNTRLRLFDVCIFPFFISCTNKNNIIETKIENTYNKNKNQNKNSQLARSMIVSTRFIISFQNFPFNFLFQSLQLTT